jgi:2-oxoglutarate ferredoxin oxidoreductase subunit alpha
VVAASTPANCFHYAFEASRLALEHMTPVVLMTDGFLANGSEPFKVPDMDQLPEIKAPVVPEGTEDYMPYRRDPETLVRGWAIPGTPGLEHRIGGLEKDGITGNVSYDPLNHEEMTHIRADKVEKIVNDIPQQEVEGDQEGDLLLVGWGSTYGHLISAMEELQAEGRKVGLAHFNYINPLPGNTGEVFGKFKKILVCELNLGQFANYLRMKFQQYEYHQLNKIQGLPLTVAEVKETATKLLEE